MLDEMGIDIFEEWIMFYSEEPFSHTILRNQLAGILSGLTKQSFTDCGGIDNSKPITPDELKDKLRHFFLAKNK